MEKTLRSICALVSFLGFCGCDLGPRSLGEAGADMVFLVPGDRIVLDDGKQGYVDGDGLLRGVSDTPVLAAGRRGRDVVADLTVQTPFSKYQIMHSGKREVEVLGAIKYPGKYPYPGDEEWNIMDLILQVEGFTPTARSQNYLLVRESWDFPGTFVFIRGEAIPGYSEMGGDALTVLSGDRIIFPGKSGVVYVFGAVADQAECFSFSQGAQPTLKVAVEQAGGPSDLADLENMKLYRVLRSNRQSIFTLDWETSQGFELEPWDVVYVPVKLPKNFIPEG